MFLITLASIELSCYTNNIKELDLSHNANLEILNCGETEIKELDLSKNTKLKELDCSSLDLENLDVSGLPMLEDLVCCYREAAGTGFNRQSETGVFELCSQSFYKIES